MKQTITYRALYDYHMQLIQMQQANSVMIFLNRSRISELYDKNGGGLRIRTIQEKPKEKE